VTYSCVLYTTSAECGANFLPVNISGTTYYAPLDVAGHANASHLRVKKSSSVDPYAILTAAAAAGGGVPSGLYVACAMATISSVAKYGPMYYNGSVWAPVGGITTSMPFRGIAKDSSGNLILGSANGNSMALPGGVTTVGIAKWNGTNWSAFGSGLSGMVYRIAFDNNGVMYAGGTFTLSGSTTLNKIARWSGTSWEPLGTGVDGTVWDIVFDANNTLYCAGTFNNAGGVAANKFAKWDGSSWSALGAGVTATDGRALLVSGNTLYIGGVITAVGGVAAYGAAKYDIPSNTLSPMTGLNIGSTVYDMIIAPDGSLYVGGNLTSYCQRWDGSSWSVPGSGISSSVFAFSRDASTGIYATGSTAAALGVRKLTGLSWLTVGSGITFTGGYGSVFV